MHILTVWVDEEIIEKKSQCIFSFNYASGLRIVEINFIKEIKSPIAYHLKDIKSFYYGLFDLMWHSLCWYDKVITA